MWTLVALAVLIVVVVWVVARKEPYSPPRARAEDPRGSPLVRAPATTRPAPPVPRDPLAAALNAVVDAAGAAPGHGGEEVPYDRGEVHDLMQIVVGRVNDRTPELELHLISVEGVRKAVDPYKTLRYEADVVVYSKARNVTSKLAAAVDVMSSGRVMVRRLTPHGATAPSGTEPTAAAEAEPFARFEPALTY